uniref:Uncharacterized protein n=1 Tax=Heterorhabditis bacteriophora TaxID=37862 RepID=A0A1I7WNR9_HETBA
MLHIFISVFSNITTQHNKNISQKQLKKYMKQKKEYLNLHNISQNISLYMFSSLDTTFHCKRWLSSLAIIKRHIFVFPITKYILVLIQNVHIAVRLYQRFVWKSDALPIYKNDFYHIPILVLAENKR